MNNNATPGVTIEIFPTIAAREQSATPLKTYIVTSATELHAKVRHVVQCAADIGACIYLAYRNSDNTRLFTFNDVEALLA